MNIDLSQMI